MFVSDLFSFYPPARLEIYFILFHVKCTSMHNLSAYIIQYSVFVSLLVAAIFCPSQP